MNRFEKEFITELFLDTDSVSTINRLVVAISDVVNENSDNLCAFQDLLKKENAERITHEEPQEYSYHHVPPRRTRGGFYEHILLNYDDDEYLETFKMKKRTVEALIMFLKDSKMPGASLIPFEKKIHIFLYLLTSDSSYEDIGVLFGLHKSSINSILHEISSLLAEQRHNFINWPSLEEQHLTRLRINSRLKFPNCVGFIDACRFRIGPKRKGKDKPEIVLLQAVCDDSFTFLDVHVGSVGRTRKTKLFKESHLSQDLKKYILYDNHLLGNSEYKLCANLITPYTSEEILTSEEMKFNEIHWKARTCIGRAFEMLKSRFRKLNFIDIVKPEYIPTLLYAACTLHNFILLHEGSSEIKEEGVMCDDGVTIDPTIVKTPLERRQFLCNYINYIDSS